MNEKDIARLRGLHFHIMSLLAQKDKETLGHCRRVGTIYAVFSEYGWDCWGERITVSELVGEIHDAGKIVLTNRALKSRGRLHGYDLILKELHPSLGAEMVPMHMPIVSNPILYHHERFDGEGYPRGLKGEKIPGSARVLSIVDVFDAMKGRRYQSPKSTGDIMGELKKNSGSQFDPHVVERFQAFLRSHKKLFAQVYQ